MVLGGEVSGEFKGEGINCSLVMGNELCGGSGGGKCGEGNVASDCVCGDDGDM